jgi:hypothetical protein
LVNIRLRRDNPSGLRSSFHRTASSTASISPVVAGRSSPVTRTMVSLATRTAASISCAVVGTNSTPPSSRSAISRAMAFKVPTESTSNRGPKSRTASMGAR